MQVAEIYNSNESHGLGGLILIFFFLILIFLFLNSNQNQW